MELCLMKPFLEVVEEELGVELTLAVVAAEGEFQKSDRIRCWLR